MSHNVKVMGADRKVINKTGSNYVPALQVSTDRTKLYKITVFVPSTVGANRVLWLFDTAAGTPSTAAPDEVLVCPPGFTTTLEYSDGSLYQGGLYIVVATDEPANASAAPATVASNNEAIVKTSYRLVA